MLFVPQTITQTITWAPVRIPLAWADSPEDVPAWDISRGVPVELYAEVGDNVPNVMGEFPLSERHTRERFWLEDAHEIRLRPRAAPEPIYAASAFEQSDYSRPSYPRLVCTEPYTLDRFDTPDTPVSQVTSRLTNYMGDLPRFKVEALKVALAYSLLSDIHDYQEVENSVVGDTLANWVSFAVFVRTHLTLARVLAEEQKRDGVWHSTNGVLDEVWLNLPQAVRSATVKRELESAQAILDGYEIRFANMSVEQARMFTKAGGLPHTVVRDAKEASGRMHSHLWRSFAARTNLTYLGTKNLHVVNGCRIWALYELSLAYERALELRTCPGCGTPFLPRRRNARYCDDVGKSRCKVAALRKRGKGGEDDTET
jgi:hypothetical protein